MFDIVEPEDACALLDESKKASIIIYCVKNASVYWVRLILTCTVSYAMLGKVSNDNTNLHNKEYIVGSFL